MGTSSSNKGTRGKDTPLIPTWLEPSNGGFEGGVPGNNPSASGTPNVTNPEVTNPAVPSYAPIPPAADPNRFRTVRSNFSRFVRSGGGDRSSLGRAISGYVSHTKGGPRNAAKAMGSSRSAGAKLLGFLSNAASNGTENALRAFNLESLAGRPVEEIFLGLRDYICPQGSTVDEGIATDSFVRTIADLADAGITDLNTLNVDQIQTVLELYMTHTVEERLYNDIGANTVILPEDEKEVENVQDQLHDFIQNGVADALTSVRNQIDGITPEKMTSFIDTVYEQTFTLLLAFGNKEANKQ
jgi:hypothetical protein